MILQKLNVLKEWRKIICMVPAVICLSFVGQLAGEEEVETRGVAAVGVDAAKVMPQWSPPAGLRRGETKPLSGLNIAIHRPYVLSVSPNYPLCSDSNDDKQLTDGEYSQGYFWTERSTVGWNRAKRVSVIIDLGEVVPIDAISINVAGSQKAFNMAGVQAPDVFFLVGNDGRKFSEVSSFYAHENKIDSRNDSYVSRRLSGGLAIEARFIAVLLQSNGSYIFADEIEVIKATGKTSPPSGAFYSLSDFAAEVDRRRSGVIKKITSERSSAARRIGIQKNIISGGGDNKFFRSLDDGCHSDQEWLMANVGLLKDLFPGRPFIVWSQDPWQDYDETVIPVVGERRASINMLAGRGETECDAVSITNASAEKGRVNVVVGELTGSAGSIPLGSIVLRVDARSDCLDGAQRADALPLVDGDVVVDPGCTRQLWTFVRVPKNQPQGTYYGSIQVSSGDWTMSVPMVVEVLPVTIPDSSPLSTLDWGYLSFPLCSASPREAVRDRFAHHINTAVVNSSHLPYFVIDDSGEIVSAKYDLFDSTMRLYDEFGFREFLFFTHMGDLNNNTTSVLGDNVKCSSRMIRGSKVWEKAIFSIFSSVVDRCKLNGIDGRRVFFYPYDEPSGNGLGSAVDVFRLLKSKGDFNFFVTIIPELSIADQRRIGDEADILCQAISVSKLKPLTADKVDYLRVRSKLGSRFWLYNCDGPDKGFHPLDHYRRLSWQAWNLGATGIGIWCYADTGGGPFVSAWTDLDGNGPDYSLVYDVATAPFGVSRAEAVIPSRRWEAYRDGIEDYSYIWSLARIISEWRSVGDFSMVKEAESDLSSAVSIVGSAGGRYAEYKKAHDIILRRLSMCASPPGRSR